jgi:hypothetical protein
MEAGMYSFMTLPGWYPGTTRRRSAVRTRAAGARAGDIVEFRGDKYVVEAIERQGQSEKLVVVAVGDYGAHGAECLFVDIGSVVVVGKVGSA